MAELEPRRSPWIRSAVLWVLFAILVALGIVTVLIPEIRDDSNEDPPAQRPPGTATPAP